MFEIKLKEDLEDQNKIVGFCEKGYDSQGFANVST